jgi:hypothetical protein
VCFFSFLPLLLPFNIIHDVLCRVGRKRMINFLDMGAL